MGVSSVPRFNREKSQFETVTDLYVESSHQTAVLSCLDDQYCTQEEAGIEGHADIGVNEMPFTQETTGVRPLAQSQAVKKNKKMTFGQAMNMMKPFAELIVAANLTTQDTLVKGFNGLLSAASMGVSSAGVSIEQCMSQHLNAFSTIKDTSTQL